MSVRDASRFSLRAILEEETSAAPIMLKQAPQPAPLAPLAPLASPAAGKQRALAFDLSSLQQINRKVEHAQTPNPVVNKEFLSLQPKNQQHCLRNVVDVAARDSSRADVMRLSALSDDLRARLKRTHEKLQESEKHAVHLNKCLVVDRAAANDRLQAVMVQLNECRASDINLKREVSSLQKQLNDMRLSSILAKESAAETERVAAQLEAALAEVKDVRARLQKAERTGAESERLLAETNAKLASISEAPTERESAEVSNSSMNSLDDERSGVECAQAAVERAQASVEAAAVVQAAREEAERVLEGARIEAAKMGEAAQADASKLLGQARAEAEKLRETTETEAKGVRAQAEADANALKSETVLSLEQQRANEASRLKMREDYAKIRMELLHAAKAYAIAQHRGDSADEVEYKYDRALELRERAQEIKLRHDTIFGGIHEQTNEEILQNNIELYSRVLSDVVVRDGVPEIQAVESSTDFAASGDAPRTTATTCEETKQLANKMFIQRPHHEGLAEDSPRKTPAVCAKEGGLIASDADKTGETMIDAIVEDISNYLKRATAYV